MSNRLDRQAWLDAALKMLASDGVDAVRVTNLATRLKVTKGSFYWHFRDRAELLDATLDMWETLATDAVIASINATSGDAGTRLSTLFSKSLNSDGRLFLAILAWARVDKRAATALETIARRRIAFVEQLFLDMGFEAPEALARATLAFQALVGQYALGSTAKIATTSASLNVIFAVLTAKPTRR